MECVSIQTNPRSCEMSQGKYWAVGEHQEKMSKIEFNIPQQEPNHFVNGFVEHPHGVCQYPNEP